MKTRLIKVTLAGSMLFLIMPILALTEEPLPMPGLLIPGTVEGTSTYFEITDSEYLNVFLQSTEEITILLESIPKTISLLIEASTTTNSTTLTLENLEPNKTYSKFEDSYKNKAVFIPDNQGKYTWTQDLAQSYHIWFQEINGTVFLPDDCNAYGIWDPDNSTCVLNRNVTSSIEITSSDIVLDCNKYSVTGTGTGYGIYLNNKTNIALKNCSINNFSYGISLYESSNNIISNNSIDLNKGSGIYLIHTSANVVENNDSSQNGWEGIRLWRSNNNTLAGNNTSNNGTSIYTGDGIHLSEYSDNNIINENIINSNNRFGIILDHSSYNTIDKNTIGSNNRNGIFLMFSDYNNLIGNVANFNNESGIWFDVSNYNILTDNNSLNNNHDGIHLWSAFRTTIINNNVSNNNRYGIFSQNSSGSFIYHNNFVDNSIKPQAYVSGGINNLFDNGYPEGGNYWSDYDTLVEGCDDNNNDSICDAPYIFTGGQDRYPFMEESGWKIPSVVDIQLTWSQNQDPDFESYRIFRDTNSGIDAGDILVATIANQTQTTFLDENLPVDAVFYYRIFVFDKAGFLTGSNETSTQ